MKSHLLAAVAALALSGVAEAANFNFTGSGRPADGRYNSLNFSSGGIGLTVTPTGNSTKVVSYWEGLGAYSRIGDLDTFDDCCLGTSASRDKLVFTFNTPVAIAGISFRQWENHFDQVRFVGGGQNFVLGNSGQGVFDLVDYFSFGAPITLQSFTLEAINGSHTALYIHGLQGVTAVPVPAAAWLLGSGLLGLAGLKRRREARA